MALVLHSSPSPKQQRRPLSNYSSMYAWRRSRKKYVSVWYSCPHILYSMFIFPVCGVYSVQQLHIKYSLLIIDTFMWTQPRGFPHAIPTTIIPNAILYLLYSVHQLLLYPLPYCTYIYCYYTHCYILYLLYSTHFYYTHCHCCSDSVRLKVSLYFTLLYFTLHYITLLYIDT